MPHNLSIYIDHNATTALLPQVKEIIVSLLHENLNPSSVHNYGRKAKAILANARNTILRALNAQEHYDLVFTASGTEANNLIIHNFRQGIAYISDVEHPSIYEQSKFYSNIQRLKVTANGQLDLNYLSALLSNEDHREPKLLSVMLANNETGIISNLAEILAIAKQKGILIHSDCVQALGKIKLDLKELPLDYLTLSAHKCGGPIGIGALVFRKTLKLIPQLIGGGQERGLRAGTEAVALAAGFATAISHVQENLEHYTRNVENLRNCFEQDLAANCPNWPVIGLDTLRLPNTSLFLMRTNSPKANLINLELHGFAVSSGSACSSGKIGASHVLSAMGYTEEDARSAIRVSLGINNTHEEIRQLVTVLKTLYNNNN